MTESVSTGPLLSIGGLAGIPNAPDTNMKAGPSIFYQGDAIFDPRFPYAGGQSKIGGNRAHQNTPYVTTLNAIPSASAATPVNIAAAQNTTSGTALTLAAASTGIATAIPFIPLGTSGAIVSGITLDYGFATLNCTANSTTVTPSNMAPFVVGQSLIVANVGNAGGTAALITQVRVVGTTTLTLSVAPLATNAAAPVGNGNNLSPISTTGSIAWSPAYAAGAAGLYNPADGIARGVGIACSATGGGGAFTTRGYDIYGVPMSETITHPGGAVVAYGKKAFKHIVSVTPSFTDGTRTYSVGTSDVLGFGIRNDFFEENEVYVGGALITANTGYTLADATNPATATTGDVRGTIQVGTRGPLGSGVGSTALGALRVKLAVMPSLYGIVNAGPAGTISMYGVTQA